MELLGKILKFAELGAWAITTFIAGLFALQVLNTFYGIGGTVNTQEALARLYITLLFFTLPISIKGARKAIS